MTDFHDFLDELGEEIVGAQWPMFRGLLSSWADANPEKLAALEKRVRDYGRTP